MIIWSPGVSLESMEERVIQEAINFYRDEKKAADSLKISHKDLLKKMKRHQEEIKRIDDMREREQKKHDDFVLRARGIM